MLSRCIRAFCICVWFVVRKSTFSVLSVIDQTFSLAFLEVSSVFIVCELGSESKAYSRL